MPTLQISPATESAAHAAALDRAARGVPTAAAYVSQLRAAHDAMVARANKVTQREPNLITTFALGDVIHDFKIAQILHMQQGNLAESITLNSVIAKLTALIPV